MEKNRLIIVEGPQGAGKSTLANYLRDNIAGSNLFRLSGQKDKTKTGLQCSIKMYDALMNYLRAMQEVPMDMVFDRTFMTEEVYARLGYKEYSFTDVYKKLVLQFNELNYDIYYFSLYLEKVETYIQRLARDHHHNYQAFSLESSINQQNTYLQIADELNLYENINVIKLPMDDFDKAYEEVNKVLKIK